MLSFTLIFHLWKRIDHKGTAMATSILLFGRGSQSDKSWVRGRGKEVRQLIKGQFEIKILNCASCKVVVPNMRPKGQKWPSKDCTGGHWKALEKKKKNVNECVCVDFELIAVLS